MYFIKHFPCTTQESTIEAQTSSNTKSNQQKGIALAELSTTRNKKPAGSKSKLRSTARTRGGNGNQMLNRSRD
jgi:hypothetical protein